MLGTYALRSGYYDAYYKKAQQVRTLIKRDFDKAWHHVDVVLTPTTPTRRVRVRREGDRRSRCTSADVFTLACNLAGLPGHQRAVRPDRRCACRSARSCSASRSTKRRCCAPHT